MVVGISVPFAKGPGEDIAALAFVQNFEASLRLLDIPFYTVKGTSPKTMLNLSTSEARSTEYSRELSSTLSVSSIHIDLQGFDNESNPEWIRSDIVFGVLPTFTNEEQMQAFANLTREFAWATVKEIDIPSNYASGLSEFVFDTPSIPIKLNVGSVDLYPALAEVVAESVVAEVLQRKQQDSLGAVEVSEPALN